MAEWGLGRPDTARELAALTDAGINYSPAEVRRPAWTLDTHLHGLPAERPGPPEPGGPWERACRLVRDYEFTPPESVRALYDPAVPLLGRNMLLQLRFHGLHLYCGVRITEVVDETRNDGARVWGWAYETLDGHLERGKVTYEVVKYRDTGRVEFVAASHSQRAPHLDPVLTLGWSLFGRRAQLRFYRRCGERIRAAVSTDGHADPVPPATPPRAGGLVSVPSDAGARLSHPPEIHCVAPGG
ncbi:DUF1990 family protein [Saccharomonospora iraqiensis]|uniref:DUF1990 family protein n=1 Tax=Saccharomonospora iraqiensis TaxID=52698 RepID=UPI00041AF1F1|nr:DUF1990 family protein [Saccharomonospora iraqiensis]